MRRWKVRALALLTAVAMLLAVTGPAAMADDFDDCEFVGFDIFGNPVFVCDDDDDDGFFIVEECLGAEIGGECFGLVEDVEVFFF